MAKILRRGQYKTYIEIERLDETESDTQGGVVPQWQTVETRWANVVPMTNRELYEAQQVEVEISHRVTFDYCPGLLVTDRIHWVDVDNQDRYAYISSFYDEEENGVTHVCRCIERAG
jgi:SPP1 family predicted phage head-tail adaptor